jgi:hypothetical protein
MDPQSQPPAFVFETRKRFREAASKVVSKDIAKRFLRLSVEDIVLCRRMVDSKLSARDRDQLNDLVSALAKARSAIAVARRNPRVHAQLVFSLLDGSPTDPLSREGLDLPRLETTAASLDNLIRLAKIGVDRHRLPRGRPGGSPAAWLVERLCATYLSVTGNPPPTSLKEESFSTYIDRALELAGYPRSESRRLIERAVRTLGTEPPESNGEDF